MKNRKLRKFLLLLTSFGIINSAYSIYFESSFLGGSQYWILLFFTSLGLLVMFFDYMNKSGKK